MKDVTKFYRSLARKEMSRSAIATANKRLTSDWINHCSYSSGDWIGGKTPSINGGESFSVRFTDGHVVTDG
jgi:hypothetical protein